MKYLFPVLLGLAACGKDGGGAARPAARDSAGIAIMENPLPASSLERRMDSLPALSIGGGAGGADYDLNEVRSAARLSDGRIVVADNSAGELRFYDSSGTFLARAGRKGKGPGEFEQIVSLQVIPGDTLAIFDISTRRLSFMSLAGDFLRDVDLAQRGFMIPVGRLADGTIVATGFSFNPSTMPSKGTVYRNPLPVLLVAPGGGAPDTMATFEGPEVYTEELSFGGRSFPAPMTVQFGRSTTVFASGSTIYVGDNARPEIAAYGRDGKLVRLIRSMFSPEAVTEAVRKAQEAENLELITRVPGMPQEMLGQAQDMIRRAKYAERFPPFQSIVADRTGNLWVQEYAMPGGPLRFSIHDSTGARVAMTWLPARFQPMDIGEGYVLGVWRDDDGVEHVRLYRGPSDR